MYTGRQKTLIGVFPDVPECLKAWEIVKKIASSGNDVRKTEPSLVSEFIIYFIYRLDD